MIRIVKPKKPIRVPYRPDNGSCRLVNAADRLKTRYDNGSRNFSFDASLYGHALIKDAVMVKAQHNKCCYCEKSIKDDITVEHFRPKKGYRQNSGTSLMTPGYYWLAYDWDNLLYACNHCNRFKENQFPLGDDRKRVKNHRNDPKCAREVPMLINPSKENPKKYFRFIGADIKEKNLKDEFDKRRAKKTIEVIGLDRRGLFEERAEVIQEILTVKGAFLNNARTQAQKRNAHSKFKAYLKSKVSPEQKFSYMIECEFAKYL